MDLTNLSARRSFQLVRRRVQARCVQCTSIPRSHRRSPLCRALGALDLLKVDSARHERRLVPELPRHLLGALAGRDRLGRCGVSEAVEARRGALWDRLAFWHVLAIRMHAASLPRSSPTPSPSSASRPHLRRRLRMGGSTPSGPPPTWACLRRRCTRPRPPARCGLSRKVREGSAGLNVATSMPGGGASEASASKTLPIAHGLPCACCDPRDR